MKPTFHLARHTFATTVTLANGVPIESVSKMLGHTKISTTQIYAKVVEQKLSQDMMALKSKPSRATNNSIENDKNQTGSYLLDYVPKLNYARTIRSYTIFSN